MTHQLTEAAIVRPSRDMETNPIPLSMRSKVWTSWAVLYHLPEGDLKIARQFTAGFKFDIPNVPKGRMNRAKPTGLLLIPSLWQNFSRPFGTCCPYSPNPPLKGWAIFKSPSGRWQANPLRWLPNRGFRISKLLMRSQIVTTSGLNSSQSVMSSDATA